MGPTTFGPNWSQPAERPYAEPELWAAARRLENSPRPSSPSQSPNSVPVDGLEQSDVVLVGPDQLPPQADLEWRPATTAMLQRPGQGTEARRQRCGGAKRADCARLPVPPRPARRPVLTAGRRGARSRLGPCGRRREQHRGRCRWRRACCPAHRPCPGNATRAPATGVTPPTGRGAARRRGRAGGSARRAPNRLLDALVLGGPRRRESRLMGSSPSDHR